MAGHVADALVARHPAGRVADVLEASAAQPTRNTVGWIVKALAGDWDVTTGSHGCAPSGPTKSAPLR